MSQPRFSYMISHHRNRNSFLDYGVCYYTAAQFSTLDGILSGRGVWWCVVIRRACTPGVMNGSTKVGKKRKWQNALVFLLVSLQTQFLSPYDPLTSISPRQIWDERRKMGTRWQRIHPIRQGSVLLCVWGGRRRTGGHINLWLGSTWFSAASPLFDNI